MEELMEEYNQNINDPLVVIPTAGLGSRLGYLTHSFNKSLLPFQNKPILSHIIENFPKNFTKNFTKFIFRFFPKNIEP